MQKNKKIYPLWNKEKTIGSDDLQISFEPGEFKSIKETPIKSTADVIGFPCSIELLPKFENGNMIIYKID